MSPLLSDGGLKVFTEQIACLKGLDEGYTGEKMAGSAENCMMGK